MAVRHGGTNHRGFDIFRADMHHMGFGVIDPDDGMVVRHDVLSLCDIERQEAL
jgi:hypothetical protein